MVLPGIVAQQAHVCHITSRFHAVRDGSHHAQPAFPDEPIQMGSAGRFERSLASQFIEGVIAHAVAD